MWIKPKQKEQSLFFNHLIKRAEPHNDSQSLPGCSISREANGANRADVTFHVFFETQQPLDLYAGSEQRKERKQGWQEVKNESMHT